jgi:endonuclease/exonuclease/phosphatase family metal-dependent hydrolase
MGRIPLCADALGVYTLIMRARSWRGVKCIFAAFLAPAVFSGKEVRPVLQTPGAAAVRPLASIGSLRVGTYNVLNLFRQVGKHVPDPENPGRLKKVSPAREKEEWALREEARVILDSGLDIVTLEEVEDIQALDDFNERYLGGRYRTFLIEGNDERGIDIAFLVKKDLPLDIEYRTHKGELWTDPVLGGEPRPLFSRDLPEMIVRAQGSGKPLFILFGTHYKSKRDRPGDPASRIVAKAQVERTADLVEAARREFGADVPILLAGDFNGDVNADDTFATLWERAGLSNSLDLGEAPVPAAERVTHTYHPKNGPTHAAQMDVVAVSGGMRGLVRKAEIYRYQGADGKPKPIPRTYEERSRNPSDHFPLFVTLDFQPLVRRALP